MDIYGVIGWPVKHTLSPAMHNAAFKELGMQDKAKYIKIPIEPDVLEDFLLKDIEVKDTEGNPVRSKEILGFNITIPHKIKAKEILKERFDVAKSGDIQEEYLYYDKMTGAVNTVKRNGDDIEYCNTDPIGFRHSLVNDLGFGRTKGKSTLIIGCGGASRAVVAELAEPNNSMKKIYLYDINREAVDSAKRHYFSLGNLENKIMFIYDSKELLKLRDEIDLLVNTSPMGMEEGDERLAVDRNLLRKGKGLYVFDLVYNRKTRLFKEAFALGCYVVDGAGMLAAQGAFSFSLWTGVPAVKVLETMRNALKKALS